MTRLSNDQLFDVFASMKATRCGGRYELTLDGVDKAVEMACKEQSHDTKTLQSVFKYVAERLPNMAAQV